MSGVSFRKSALTGLLLFGSQVFAPAQTVSSNTPGTSTTTGIVGMTASQTARLNVLNLQPVIPGVTAVACPATLEFYDDTGALLKQTAVTSISPATTASLTFKPTVSAANGRAQIRAVVFTPVTSVVNPDSSPLSMAVMPISSGCRVMASLEIVDDTTGETRLFTTDLRAMPVYRLMTLPAMR